MTISVRRLGRRLNPLKASTVQGHSSGMQALFIISVIIAIVIIATVMMNWLTALEMLFNIMFFSGLLLICFLAKFVEIQERQSTDSRETLTGQHGKT